MGRLRNQAPALYWIGMAASVVAMFYFAARFANNIAAEQSGPSRELVLFGVSVAVAFVLFQRAMRASLER